MLQLRFLEKLKNSNLLVDFVDSSKLREEFDEDRYGRLVNRPGLNGLKHFKARRFLQKVSIQG